MSATSNTPPTPRRTALSMAPPTSAVVKTWRGNSVCASGRNGLAREIEQSVASRLGLNAVERLNDTRAKQTDPGEGQLSKIVFSFPLDPRPHRAAALGAVGTGARHIDERHPRIEPGQGRGHRYRHVVGQMPMSFLGHSRGGHSHMPLQRSDKTLKLTETSIFGNSKSPLHEVHFLPGASAGVSVPEKR
jgi:hypothetical protein